MKAGKVTAVMILLMGFAGVVQASGIHGEYKGDPVVRVLSGGKELLVEDVPAVIRDGRTVVPLYMLREAGVTVKWDPERYNVELAVPDPAKEISGKLNVLNAKAKEYNAEHVRLIQNEYGSYLQLNFHQSNDSNLDNERIIALSGVLADFSVDLIAVQFYRNEVPYGVKVIQRQDLLDFRDKKLKDYEFIKKWKDVEAKNAKEFMVPNKPPEPAPETPKSQYGGPICQNIHFSSARASANAVNSYNADSGDRYSELEKRIKEIEENKKKALQEAHCPLE